MMYIYDADLNLASQAVSCCIDTNCPLCIHIQKIQFIWVRSGHGLCDCPNLVSHTRPGSVQVYSTPAAAAELHVFYLWM